MIKTEAAQQALPHGADDVDQVPVAGDQALSQDRRWPRTALFCALGMILTALFWRQLSAWVKLALQSDLYEDTLFIPFLSGTFLYVKRRAIFAEARFDAPLSIPFLSAGGILVLCDLRYAAVLGASIALTLSIFSFLVFLVAGFALCYGWPAMRAAAFPELALLLMVPLPSAILNGVVLALQHWSANGADLLFHVLGVPVHRAGLAFDLPGVSIYVTEECSGIHSSLALFITVLAAAQLSLKSNWNKLVLLALVVPIAVVKNSIRITTLATLGVYVDPGFLHGWLHHNGGVVFFLLGLAVLMAVMRLLALKEQWNRERPDVCL